MPRPNAGPAANRQHMRQGALPASRRGQDSASATERTWLQQEQDAAMRLQQGGGLFGNHDQGFQMPPPDEESIATLMVCLLHSYEMIFKLVHSRLLFILLEPWLRSRCCHSSVTHICKQR